MSRPTRRSERALVSEARARRPARPTPRELVASAVAASTFLVAAVAFAAVGNSRLHVSPLVPAVLVLGFAGLSKIQLESASGAAVPTQLFFVPMLLLLPLPLVPLCVCAGYVAGFAVDVVRGRSHPLRGAAVVGSSWFAVAPALILYAKHVPAAWSSWPWWLAAFTGQCLLDLLHSTLHERVAHDVAPRELLRPLAHVYAFDALLSPVAVVAALGAGPRSLAFLALVPLIMVFAGVAIERRRRLDAQIEAHTLGVLAHHDPLTTLGNRRKLDADLARVAGGAFGQWLLLLFDLDRFKAYNDHYGHPAGDDLLMRLGRRLGEVSGAHAYRLGGDEFCVLVPEDLGTDELVSGCVGSLSESGDDYSLASSVGRCRVPAEATTPAGALRLADLRLYAQKGERSSRSARDDEALLIRLVRDGSCDLDTHADQVAELALEVGAEIGLTTDELEALRRASLFHDIGKVTIPVELLEHPGPLAEGEWQIVRTHTISGERIVASVPSLREVGAVIRSTHERWDGTGYPDGLAGEAIPLAARIISVCDAYDAMTTDRPYRRARSVDSALEELAVAAGAQFDPFVVAALVDALDRDRRRPVSHGSAAPAPSVRHGAGAPVATATAPTADRTPRT